MANNYTQSTVEPYLPLTARERDMLADCGAYLDKVDGGKYYIYFPEFMGDALVEVQVNEDGDEIEVYEEVEYILQRILKRLDPAEYTHITVQGSWTCDKMRPDNFGGFASLITRDKVESINTWDALQDMIRKMRNTEVKHSADKNMPNMQGQ